MARPLSPRAIASRAWLVLLLLTCLAGNLPATILEKVDFDRLCQSADSIVVGTCTTSACRWDRNQTTILTVFGFDLSQTIKGTPARSVRVTTLGGVIGDRGMNVAGSPRFRIGEEYVLFLERDPEGGWRCKGWSQGCYRVFVDPATRTRSVKGDTSGASLMGKDSTAIEEGRPGRPIALSTFIQSIQGHAAKGGAR
jgi:hypothetical protein